MSDVLISPPRLLAGPDPRLGAESYVEHLRRLGPLPAAAGLVETLERSGLRGRGGAAFPVGQKWGSIASRRSGSAVVVANGCEGEPLSRKDRVLMSARPHLVLDGAFLARQALWADRLLLVVAGDLGDAPAAMAAALAERPEPERRAATLITASSRYVSGESSALVNLVNGGVAVPTNVPPRPHEVGVDGAPTLVQNVESLAHVGLIARHGDAWFRSAGRGSAAGALLLTLQPAGAAPTVLEVEAGTPVGEALEAAGGSVAQARAILLGGYFGSWLPAADAWGLPLNPAALAELGLSLGAGIVAALGPGGCVVCETTRVARYLAGESSAQCGPCFYGLRAIADACDRIQAGEPEPGELERLRRWAGDVRGRRACHHPDGAAGFLASALRGFGADFENHRPHRGGGGLS